ncbi:MAG TPA: helix-turn-helix domain-containing protein [Solirubrobacterales bacterium]|jgi:AcrR family transcriptional regulator|nr:helix-turn-helix domain-containing protein [Solirubrobacterales bacterium]
MGEKPPSDRPRGAISPRQPPALPAALAKLPPGRHRLPPEFVQENQRSRILAAALEVFGTRGFAATSVQDLVREAHVSRGTLYAHFSGKEACFLGLLDEAVDYLWAQAASAAAEENEWAARLCATSERIVALLAEDRRLARVCAVEVLAAGDQVRSRCESLIGEVGAAMRAGRAESSSGPQPPESLEAVLFTGAVSVIGQRLVRDGGQDAGAVAAELSELLLIPYMGSAEARALVRSRRGVRTS